MKSLGRYLTLLWLTLLMLTACKDNVYFSSVSHLDGGLWHIEDTLDIDIGQSNLYERARVDSIVCLNIGIRYTDSYRFQKLFMEVELSDSIHTLMKDTMEFDIPADGGEGFRYREQMKEFCSFVPRDSIGYRLRISHIMIQNPLEGICDIVCLAESKK